MKAMTRKELAIRADVTTKTLGNWMKPHWQTLWDLGMRPNQILPPKVVAWMSWQFGINVED